MYLLSEIQIRITLFVNETISQDERQIKIFTDNLNSKVSHVQPLATVLHHSDVPGCLGQHSGVYCLLPPYILMLTKLAGLPLGRRSRLEQDTLRSQTSPTPVPSEPRPAQTKR